MTLNSGNSWSASAWSDYGGAATFPASTVSSGSSERWSIGNAYSTAALTTGGNTYSKQYYHQYQQTLSYSVVGGGSPSAPTATGSAFGSAYAPSLTTSVTAYWFDASGSITFSTSAGGVGERWAHSPASVSAASSGSQVVNMYHQYQVTFAQANLGGDALGTVVTVNGVGKVYGDLPFSLWVDSSGSVAFSYAATVSSSASGKQYIVADVDASSPLMVTGSVTVTGSYKTQYQVTFAKSGLDSDAIGANATTDNVASQWVDSGTSLTFSYAGTVSSSIQGKQFVLSSVSAASPLTVAAPTTINASYTTQYQISFTVNPTDGGITTPSGTTNLWTNAGDLSISATPNVGYAFSSWTATGPITFASPSLNSTTATVNGAGTITANFITVAIPYTTTTIVGIESNATTVPITIGGNVTAQQMSNVTITPNQSTATTTVSFTITGPSGTVGFSNMTIPKTAIPYGTAPVLYIDGQQASNQGYTQDANNFYVWYTTQFITHQVTVTIQFTAAKVDEPSLSLVLAFVAVIVVILISAAIAFKRYKRKPHN